jgi:hypothetical protein
MVTHLPIQRKKLLCKSFLKGFPMKLLLLILIVFPMKLTMMNPTWATVVAIPEHQLNCLIKNAYYEAMTEGKIGRQQVTKVVINRTRDNNFCKTVYQPYQFSWTPILAEALEECYIEAQTTGNVSAALMGLADQFEHEKFKEIIINLEVCSRYTANLKVIVDSLRRNLMDAKRASQERRATANR